MRDGGGWTFRRLAFEPHYDAEAVAEFPGDGNWPCPEFCFEHDGSVVADPVLRRGTPLIVQVTPFSAPEWVGVFPAGGLGVVNGVFGTPAPDKMIVVVDGAAYLLAAVAPEAGALLLHEQVNQVVPVAGMPLLLLAGSTDIVAVGPQGVAWRSPRLGMDDLRVLDANQSGIRCSVAALGGHPVPIVLHPALGQ